eukprot:1285311-Amphidinium_carterae.2
MKEVIISPGTPVGASLILGAEEYLAPVGFHGFALVSWVSTLVHCQSTPWQAKRHQQNDAKARSSDVD